MLLLRFLLIPVVISLRSAPSGDSVAPAAAAPEAAPAAAPAADTAAASPDSAAPSDSASSTTSSNSTSTPTNSPTEAPVSVPLKPRTLEQMVAVNSGFQSCPTAAAGQPCAKASAELVLRMSDGETVMKKSLTTLNDSLSSIISGQTAADSKISAMSSAIFGASPDDEKALVKQIQKTRTSISTINSEATDVAQNVSSAVISVVTALGTELDKIKAVMNTQLTAMQTKTQEVLTSTAALQQNKIATVAAGFSSEKANLLNQVSTNTGQISDQAVSLKSDAAGVKAATDVQIAAVNKGADDAADDIAQIKQDAKDQVGSLNKVLTTQMQSGIQKSLDDASDEIGSSAQGVADKISSTGEKLTAELTGSVDTLSLEAEKLKTDLQAGISSSQKSVDAFSSNADAAVSEYSATANALVTKLNGTATASASGVQKGQDDAEELANTVGGALNQLAGKSSASIATATNNLEKGLDEAQNDVSRTIGNAFGQIGSELERVNTDIAGSKTAAADLVNKLKETAAGAVADANGQIGGNSEAQAKALADVLDAVGSSGDMLDAKIKEKGDSLEGRFSALVQTLLGSLDESSEMTAELGAGGRSQAARTGEETAKLVANGAAKISEQTQQQSAQQQAAVDEIKKTLMGLTGASAEDMKKLNAALAALAKAQGGNEAGAAALVQALIDSASKSESDSHYLANLLATSASAANAAEQSASQAVGSQVNGLLTGLKGSLQEYAGQFSSLFGGQLSGAQQQVSDLLSKLASSSNSQKAIASDAKAHLTTLVSSLNALSTPAEKSYADLQQLLKDKAKAASLAQQAHLADIQSKSDTQLDDLRTSLASAIGSQSTKTASEMTGLYNTIRGKVNDVVSTLQQQAEAVAKLESAAKYDSDAAATWAEWFATQVNTEREAVRQTSGEQTEALASLQTLISNWSSEVDKNVTDTRAKLEVALAQLPDLTSAKLTDTADSLEANSKVMSEYIEKLKVAFEAQRSAEAAYVQQQSLLRLSAILGVDRATLETKVGLMTQVDGAGLTGTALAQKMAAALASLADAVQASDAQDGKLMKDIKDQVSSLGSNAASLTGFFQNQLSKEFSEVYVQQQEAQAAMSKMIAEETARTGNYSQALAGQLKEVTKALEDSSIRNSLAMAGDKKNLFSLTGDMTAVSDQARLQLVRLLHEVQKEVEEAQRVNKAVQATGSAKISSVHQVLAQFSDVIGGYLKDSRAQFDQVRSRLATFKGDVSTRLKKSEDYVVALAGTAGDAAGATSESQSALSDRMQTFSESVQKDLVDLEQERSAMLQRSENEVSELRAAVDRTVSKVKVMQDKADTDIQSWLDSEETRVDDLITNATKSLSSGTAKISFLRRTDELV